LAISITLTVVLFFSEEVATEIVVGRLPMMQYSAKAGSWRRTVQQPEDGCNGRQVKLDLKIWHSGELKESLSTNVVFYMKQSLARGPFAVASTLLQARLEEQSRRTVDTRKAAPKPSE
jgi:hypothetical protein